MIQFKDEKEKTYEQRMAQAIMQIPLICSDWTNFNPSDPGMTVLESLSLFETLQQEHINEMPPEVKAALLKMCGFKPKRGRGARALLLPLNATEEFVVPKGQRFRIGELSFETIRDIKAGKSSIERIYSVHNELEPTEDDPDNYRIETNDMTYLMDRDMVLPIKVFGDNPNEEDALYFLCNSIPGDGENLILYIEVSNDYMRNSFEDGYSDMFASVEWQIYTESGFVSVVASDHTSGFVFSGEITLHMPSTIRPVVYEDDLYCIRAVVKKALYDISPSIVAIHGFLFEVWQQDTRTFTQVANRAGSIEIRNDLTRNHYILVFAKEGKGSSYRQYMPYHDQEEEGRYYKVTEKAHSTVYSFDKQLFGYGPEKGKKAIRVIGYTEEIMRRYRLGVVEGYDNQRLSLPINNIVSESFFVIAKRYDEDGVAFFDFVRPEHSYEDALFYHLHERTGEIEIVDAGAFIGAELFMGGCAVYSGELGNVRAGNRFVTDGILRNYVFVNPCDGTGGGYTEDLESVRRRFTKDIDVPYSAVTEKDYEYLVKTTPGLCIQKAKAYMNPTRNEVKVAVLTGIIGKNGYPMLTPEYQQIIEDRLESHRLLSTKITVVKPVFAPVNVSATIIVNQSYEHTKERLEHIVGRVINYMKSNKNIGEILKFSEVFTAIEEDPGVVFIQQLSLKSAKNQLAVKSEQDIVPNPNVILIPGSINLELITYHK